MPSKRIQSTEYKAAAEERSARERGRTLPFYAGKVAKSLAKPPKRGKVTPSKRQGH